MSWTNILKFGIFVSETVAENRGKTFITPILWADKVSLFIQSGRDKPWMKHCGAWRVWKRRRKRGVLERGKRSGSSLVDNCPCVRVSRWHLLKNHPCSVRRLADDPLFWPLLPATVAITGSSLSCLLIQPHPDTAICNFLGIIPWRQSILNTASLWTSGQEMTWSAHKRMIQGHKKGITVVSWRLRQGPRDTDWQNCTGDSRGAWIVLLSPCSPKKRQDSRGNGGESKTNRKQSSLLLLSPQLLMYSPVSRGEEHSSHRHPSLKLPVWGDRQQILRLRCRSGEGSVWA